MEKSSLLISMFEDLFNDILGAKFGPHLLPTPFVQIFETPRDYNF